MSLDAAGITQVPAGTTMEPVGSTQAPAGTTMEPVDTTQAPAGTTMEPVDTTQVPAGTTMEPVDTTQVPAGTTMEPVDTTQVPAGTTEPVGGSCDENGLPTRDRSWSILGSLAVMRGLAFPLLVLAGGCSSGSSATPPSDASVAEAAPDGSTSDGAGDVG